MSCSILILIKNTDKSLITTIISVFASVTQSLPQLQHLQLQSLQMNTSIMLHCGWGSDLTTTGSFSCCHYCEALSVFPFHFTVLWGLFQQHGHVYRWAGMSIANLMESHALSVIQWSPIKPPYASSMSVCDASLHLLLPTVPETPYC